MTDEIEEAQPQDATAEPSVPSAIAQLGVEARAEYIRARQRLGLGGGPTQQLGTVGRYRLEAEIGRGGMGIVFRASDPELDRPVAIKLVQAVPFARYDKLRTRLLREAKVLAKLTHPNVVRVYDCGQHEGEVYLAMEYVEGAPLRDWQHGQSQRSILDAYRQAARGLEAAHDLGITHRDFKPDNVLVASDGRVLVGDFGLAGVPAGDELRAEGAPTEGSPGERVSATRTGALLGTPTYMAPEQLRGEVATARSDQFAFCVSLWEALTGVRPFEGDTREGLAEQIEQGRVRGSERLPRRLRAKLLRGLAADPAKRFERLSELGEGLVPRRGRVVFGVGVAASLAVGVGVGTLLLRDAPPPCELSTLVDEVAAMPQWERLRERPELRPTNERLLRLLDGMRMESERLCRPSHDEQFARQERLTMRTKYLRNVLDSPVIENPAKLREEVEFLERWTAPPPRPVDDDIEDLLRDSDADRLANRLGDAIQKIDQAVIAADGRDLELALAYRWRGRVLGPMARYGEALEAYRAAESHADAAAYDDARLEAELLAAEIAVMRLGDLSRARESLKRADILLRRLGEPWLSPRWANYQEISAAVLKREGQLDEALVHQRYALLVRGWWNDEVEVALGHLNLGTIHEMRGTGSDLELARINYERAFQALEGQPSSPEWCEAAFNLGHWLVQYGEPSEWTRAEQLLEQVRTGSKDLLPSALTDLVMLNLRRNNFEDAKPLAQTLEISLPSDSSRDSTDQLSTERRLDAWLSIALAYAMAGELASFEKARASFDQVAREVLANASRKQSKRLQQQIAEFDLTAASGLQEAAPDRARTLATSARDFFLQIPAEKRPTGMLEAANEIILALDPPISTVTP